MSPQPALQPSPWSQMVGARTRGDGEQPRTSPGCVVALGSQTVAGTTWARWDEEKEGLAEGSGDAFSLGERPGGRGAGRVPGGQVLQEP